MSVPFSELKHQACISLTKEEKEAKLTEQVESNARECQEKRDLVVTKKREDYNLAKENEELKKQVQTLKRKLFWTKYSINDIRKAFAQYNDCVTECTCLNCACGGRILEHEDAERAQGFDCKWQPPIEAQMKKLGITYTSLDGSQDQSKAYERADKDGDFVNEQLYTDDVHFLLWPRMDWVYFYLAAKLWTTKTPYEDVETRKLMDLVDWLYSEADKRRMELSVDDQ